MCDHAGRDNGTLRVTIREAAIRKRIQRGSLGKEMGRDGRVYVYLGLSLARLNLNHRFIEILW
jgi:hypothetical protein